MRDFRDAKAMAHALRHALQVQAVATTHSECLELIAQAFGYENWNILSARIEAAQLQAPGASALAPVAEHDPAPQKTLHCSFCGKSQHDVTALIAGPTVFICNECVGLCDDILVDRELLNLLKADEESGNQAYPAAVAYLRAEPSETVASCVERSRRGVDRSRVELRNIQHVIATRDSEDPTAQDPAVPHWLKNKTRDELVVSASDLERVLNRYEVALRLATAVLEARGPAR